MTTSSIRPGAVNQPMQHGRCLLQAPRAAMHQGTTPDSTSSLLHHREQRGLFKEFPQLMQMTYGSSTASTAMKTFHHSTKSHPCRVEWPAGHPPAQPCCLDLSGLSRVGKGAHPAALGKHLKGSASREPPMMIHQLPSMATAAQMQAGRHLPSSIIP